MANSLSLYDTDKHLVAADYEHVLWMWTRSTRVYRFLDNKIFLTATYHASQLRQAFSVAFSDIYGHGGTITQNELVALTGNAALYHTFFLAVHTPVKSWNDLDAQDSIWHVSLHSSTARPVDAAVIERIKLDENLCAVYPYVTQFDRGYLVRFSRHDEIGQPLMGSKTKYIRLRVASAMGVAELTWNLATDAWL